MSLLNGLVFYHVSLLVRRHVSSFIVDIFIARRCPILLAQNIFLRRRIDATKKVLACRSKERCSFESPRILLSWIVARKPLLIPPRRRVMPNFLPFRARILLKKKKAPWRPIDPRFANSVAHKCGHQRALHDIAKLCKLRNHPVRA